MSEPAKKSSAQTNGDFIRSMSDEQLALWMCENFYGDDSCFHRCPASDLCVLGENGLMKWIKQPSEEV